MKHSLWRPALITLSLLFQPLLAVPLQAADPAAPPSTAADSNERLLPDKEQERMMALAASQPPSTEILWLETQHESFLGLFQPANRPEPRGGILLLPHDRTSPDWPGAMQTLRRGLPDKGWHTLALALPDEPLPLLPRFESASNAEGSEPDPLKDHGERINQRIEQGITTLRSRGVTRVFIVGEGSGAYWSSRYIQERADPTLFPILIDARDPAQAEGPLHQLTESLNRPTLDLYHGDGLGRSPLAQTAKLRADAARRTGQTNYFSVRMPPRVGDWRQTDPRLLSLVSGMLDSRLEKLTNTPQQPAVKPQQRPGRRP